MKKQILIAAVSAGVLILSACAEPSPSKTPLSDENDGSVNESEVNTSQQDAPDQSVASETDGSGGDEMESDGDEYEAIQEIDANSDAVAKSSNQPPIAVSVETKFEIDEYGTDEHRDVYIKSLVDNVTINDVILNRGNCNMNLLNKGRMPFNLVYGQRTWDRAWDNSSGRYCSVSEVEVKTDKGSFTFNI